MSISLIWLIFSFFFFILEIVTEGFLVCWVGVGGLVALLISLIFPDALYVQITVMVFVSVILIACTRKLTKKLQEKDNTPMNVYTILGKKANVSLAIDNAKGQGQIKVDGDIWSARNDENDEIIPEGSTVEIIRIDGVKAMVKKIDNQQ